MVTFIYNLSLPSQDNADRPVTEHTYAYSKLEKDKYFVVGITKSSFDKNAPKVAREIVKERHDFLLDLYKKTNGRLVAKGKYFYKIMDHEELRKFKHRINEHNKHVWHILYALRDYKVSKW